MYFEKLLMEELKPGVGCTEPAALAFAAAKLSSVLTAPVVECKVTVNLMLYRNVKYVLIPNTKLCGIENAVAIGFCTEKKDPDLEIFKDLSSLVVQNAIALQKKIPIEVSVISQDLFYVSIQVQTANELAEIILEGSHTNIKEIKKNGKILIENSQKIENENPLIKMKNVELHEIINFSEKMDDRLLSIVEEGVQLNTRASDAGLNEAISFSLGQGYMKLMDTGLFCKDPINITKMHVAAACDCRMGGLNYPVMTAIGSGNQGIGVILPCYYFGQEMKIERNRIMRAIVISLLVTAHIKSKIGRLSSICGSTIIAIANAVATTWMLGGTMRQIEDAANNVVANSTGVICDGAKGGCSLKISEGAAQGIFAAVLSINHTSVSTQDGIVGGNFRSTIDHFVDVSTRGLQHLNEVIVENM